MIILCWINPIMIIVLHLHICAFPLIIMRNCMLYLVRLDINFSKLSPPRCSIFCDCIPGVSLLFGIYCLHLPPASPAASQLEPRNGLCRLGWHRIDSHSIHKVYDMVAQAAPVCGGGSVEPPFWLRLYTWIHMVHMHVSLIHLIPPLSWKEPEGLEPL